MRPGQPALGAPRELGRSDGAAGFPFYSDRIIEAGRLQSGRNPAHAGAREADCPPDPGERSAGLHRKPYAERHKSKLRITEQCVNAIVTFDGVDRRIGRLMLVTMPRKSDIANAPNSIATWRAIRGWNQDELGARSGLAKATISRMEQKGEYTHQSLEAVAAALRKESWVLLLPPRSRAVGEILEMVMATSDDERQRILNVIRALTATAAA
jgi:transcriptional regulator with XRE-family HTH domain